MYCILWMFSNIITILGLFTQNYRISLTF
jgi:hypothetical protein